MHRAWRQNGVLACERVRVCSAVIYTLIHTHALMPPEKQTYIHTKCKLSKRRMVDGHTHTVWGLPANSGRALSLSLGRLSEACNEISQSVINESTKHPTGARAWNVCVCVCPRRVRHACAQTAAPFSASVKTDRFCGQHFVQHYRRVVYVMLFKPVCVYLCTLCALMHTDKTLLHQPHGPTEKKHSMHVSYEQSF